MHPQATHDQALALLSSGLGQRRVAARMGLPLSTVQHWARGDRRAREAPVVCPRCHGRALDEWQYTYLFGCYLGDGHISVGRRGVASLMIACADAWPGVRRETARSMRAVMPSSSVCFVPRVGCCAVKSYSTHWTCLFPQHGAGRKHLRPIVLEPWQRELVERYPGRLLRGLFHSDGCRITNWATKTTPDGTRRYEYPRYLFSNESTDILGMCEDALDRLGIPCRRPRVNMISVARRTGVAALDEHVGPKY